MCGGGGLCRNLIIKRENQTDKIHTHKKGKHNEIYILGKISVRICRYEKILKEKENETWQTIQIWKKKSGKSRRNLLNKKRDWAKYTIYKKSGEYTTICRLTY